LPNHQDKKQGGNMKNRLILRRITDNAVIAAVYVALTLLLSNLSYGQIQFRIAEILVLFVFFRKDFAIGVTLGCIIANAFSPLGITDVIFGSLATLLSVVCIMFLPNLYLAIIPPVVINAFVVGFELYYILDLPFWANVGYVALGELAVMLVGLVICLLLSRNKGFLKLIMAERPKPKIEEQN
jgi:uncharacterized membrane protein